MSSYSLTERLLAQTLNKTPWLKRLLKICYQTLNYWVYRKSCRYQSTQPLNTIPVNLETFFGYYDKSPISIDQHHILFHGSSLDTRYRPDSDTSISVCLWNVDQQAVVYQAAAKAYNWQQGARSQWLTSSKFIYNNYSDELGYHAVMVQLGDSGYNEQIIANPIYDCYKDVFALSLSYERLHKLRPDYGYRNHAESGLIAGDNEDGIFFIDLLTGQKKLLISLTTLSNIKPLPRNDKIQHKVNHIMISPNGERFMFLHRYLISGRRYDRLMVANTDGTDLTILADDEMVSHCCWLNDSEILGYLRNSLLGDKYFRIDVNTKKIDVVGSGIIDKFGDGHPSIFKNLMVFDCYPNKSRMKELFLFNLETNELIKLGEFFESLKYRGETRCDLHPRFSEDGTKIFFDSVHTGLRKLYWIDL